MFIPKLYREENREKILEFVRQNDFATVVGHDGEKPVASHLLVEVVEMRDQLVVNGHMSRANHLWRLWEQKPEVLVIFQGPHTYISPTWYDHVNVPTWNYQSIHLHGKAQIIRDHAETYAILKRLIDRYEAQSPYKLERLPEDFIEKEMKGLVAFQVEVTQIEANYKLSQNRDDANYRSIVVHLEERPDDLSQGVAQAMRKNRPSAL